MRPGPTSCRRSFRTGDRKAERLRAPGERRQPPPPTGRPCSGRRDPSAGGTAETDVGIGDGKSVACFVLPGLETMLSKTRRTSRLVTFEGLQSAASTKTGSLSSSFLLRPGEARQWAHRRKRFGVSWQKVGGNKTTKEQVFISVTAFGEWRLRRKTQEQKESIGGP